MRTLFASVLVATRSLPLCTQQAPDEQPVTSPCGFPDWVMRQTLAPVETRERRST